MLPSCVSLACAVNYLNLKAVPYTIPFKGQIAGFNLVFWPLVFFFDSRKKACVICKGDEPLSLTQLHECLS